LRDLDAARARLEGAETHLSNLRAQTVAIRYINEFEHILGRQ
jgi:hypothetical protein